MILKSEKIKEQKTFPILEFYRFLIGFYRTGFGSNPFFKTMLPSHFHYLFIYSLIVILIPNFYIVFQLK